MNLFEWLAENKCDLVNLTRKHGLRAKDVLAAAETVFLAVQNGEEIKPISVGWRIRAAAMAIQSGRELPEIKAYKEERDRSEKFLELERKKIAEEWAEIRSAKMELEKKPVPLWLKILTLWWMR
jgi:hypothetical protein